MTTYDRLRYEQLPWTEKYKPKMIEDLDMNINFINKFKVFLCSKKKLPNLLLSGITGTGKTTMIRVLMNELYGKYTNDAVYEINTFDTKTHDDLVLFCKSNIQYKNDDAKLFPKYKTLIFEHSDNINDRITDINILMEQFKLNTTFIFSCTTSASIIESIQTRCTSIIFSRIDDCHIINKMKKISDIENIKYTDDALKKLAEISNGDMRSAIISLQLVYGKNNKISYDGVIELCDYPQHVVIEKIFKYLLKNNLKKSLKIILKLKDDGYSSSDILLSIEKTLLMDDCKLSEDQKIIIYECICNTLYMISRGTDSKLQIITCLSNIIMKLHK
jgi:replication factor C subunit 2/4